MNVKSRKRQEGVTERECYFTSALMLLMSKSKIRELVNFMRIKVLDRIETFSTPHPPTINVVNPFCP